LDINVTGDDNAAVTSDPGRFKDANSSMYDRMVNNATTISNVWWNWGMNDPELAGQIKRVIPDFGRFDTDGFSEQLYYLALSGLPFDFDTYAGKSVLEVGCGMGQGLNFLSRLVNADRLVGLDLSAAAVRRANAVLSRGDALRFVQGDAERLPYEDNEFDVVINVESSHNYPDLGRFLSEVARVLKPGGYFSYLDVFTRRRSAQIDQLQGEIAGLEWIHERDISDEVKVAVRSRMEPYGRMRASARNKRRTYLGRQLAEHSKTLWNGGNFAGYEPTALIKLMTKLRIAPGTDLMVMESYRHQIARSTK
jgi:ubiquinone/menaquinone biosynthesis C-methylase UbiE